MLVSNKQSLSIIITSLILSACQFSPIKTAERPAPPATAIETADANAPIKAQPEPLIVDDREPIVVDTAAQEQQEQPRYDDLWQLIGAGLEFDRNLKHPAVQQKIRWYQNNQAHLQRVAERARPYLHYIVTTLQQRQLPLDLALLPIVESAFQPFALSPSRASGIWQFMAATGKQYGLKQNWWYDGRRDIVSSTNAALDYLQTLNQKYDGNWPLALAAYNAGPGKIHSAMQRHRQSGNPADYWSLKLPRETRQYVPNLLAIAEIIAHPQRYNIQLPAIDNSAYFTAVDVDSQLDLATVTELTGLDMDTVYRLNPGFNRWATAPDGPHRLLLPVTLADKFKQDLADLPKQQRMTWQRHRIAKGDTLNRIAINYATSVHALKTSNRLTSSRIRAGQYLLIPVAKKSLQAYTLSQASRQYQGLKRSDDGQDYVYRIKRGDTLWDISRHYGISVAQLCRWNGIQRRATLRLGQKLHIKIYPDDASSQALVKTAALGTDSGLYKVNYEVQDGDSLWLIARRFGVSIQQLRHWNDLGSARWLQPGQNLHLYTDKQPTGA